MKRNILLVLVTIALMMVARSSLHAQTDINFNRDIRSILSDNCYQCHGPDDAAREADLRLDTPDGAHAAAIVPGDASASDLIDRVTSNDPDLVMPPPESERSLSAKQIKLLRQWIDQDAKYQGHWAFEPTVRPGIPSNKSVNPIDAFLRRKQKQHHLSPAALADKSTLIRRVTLDLTGVPPTGAEAEAFLADESPDAYEKLVDRLLMSPHYGERMAIAWLDFARYADSNGFQSDGSRELWAWRDWLINSLNKNKPFDQFTVEQLAGDMLPDATKDQIIATGFNRNHRLNGEGGRIVDEWFVETVIDRVETTGLTWLGLTFNCCRCHDHKYDPISQKEFYQMFAFFNSVEESGVLSPQGKNGQNTPPLLTLKSAEQESKLVDLKAEETKASKLIAAIRKSSPKRLAKWESDREASPQPASWNVLVDLETKSAGGASFKTLEDQSTLVHGKNPGFDDYTITTTVSGDQLTGMMLEVLPHESLAQKGFGRNGNGNIVLSQLNVFLETEGAKTMPLTFDRVEADFSQPGWDVANVRAAQHKKLVAKKGWALNGNEVAKRVPRKMILVLNKPLDLPSNSRLRIEMKHRSPYTGHAIGRFRFSVSADSPSDLSVATTGLPGDIQKILAVKRQDRNAKQNKRLRDWFEKEKDTDLLAAIGDRDKAKKAAVAYENSFPTTMVMKEREPKDAFILVRGEYDKPGEKVTRGLPAALPPMPADQSMDRLGLAKWIASESNPLTARVWVNRAWEHFFGIGIVKTTENFGSQAEYPSHPELLDFLAAEFMNPTVLPQVNGAPAQNWDMKAIHKLIVTSHAYRQSSQVTTKSLEQDPDNRLVARGPRFRLTGELIRDSALSVSGLLVNKIGGPSVRPYMPAKVWDETSVYGNLRNYKHDKDQGLHRKTMYTIWKRTAAPPTMLLFDAPNREVCTIKRSRTNTPLQALSLLNEVTFIEAARGLAAKMINEGGSTPESRIEFAYMNLFSRKPTADEMLVLKTGIQSDHKYFAGSPQDAKKLIAVGDWKPETEIDPVQWATYTMTANVLLNTDEFVMRN